MILLYRQQYSSTDRLPNLLTPQMHLLHMMQSLSPLDNCFHLLHSAVRLNSLLHKTDDSVPVTVLKLEVKYLTTRLVSPHLSLCVTLCVCVPSHLLVKTCAALLTFTSSLRHCVYPLALRIGRKLLNKPHHYCHSKLVPKD